MALTTPDTGEGLVLGADIGGTSTRIAVADLTGRIVARGLGPGGNPVAHPDTARTVLAEALAQALADVEPGAVRAGVIGMAGSGAVLDLQVRAGYDAVWRTAGLPGTPEVCSDLEVAFAAGTAAPDGSVLIAGTGAVAGRLRRQRLVATAGGHGWLLGDEGSGFWIGREAVRATLAVLDGGGSATTLTGAVLRELGAGDGPGARNALVSAAYARPPVALSALAPLVTDAHRAGDPAATGILDAAVTHLLAMWDRLPEARPGEPVVLAGSLTEPGSYLGSALTEGLAGRSTQPSPAADPVIGAVRMALRSLDPAARRTADDLDPD